MWKKVAIAGAVTAAIVGTGTVALAETGSASPSPAAAAKSGSASSSNKARGKREDVAGALTKLRDVLHAQWVTKDASGTITHDAIRGAVSAVSASSISVTSSDSVAQTYAITSTTTIRVPGSGQGKNAPISDVKVGDNVVVLGTGTGSFTATRILEVPAKKARGGKKASPSPTPAPTPAPSSAPSS